MPLAELSQATVHYEQVGEGPDVVWVSGAGGTAEDWDRYQIPYFKDEFRSTTFDCRGVGTTTSGVPLPWTVEDFARDTAELIQAACEPPVTIIGLSFGGGIVQQVALDYPDLLRCVISIGTGARSVGWTWDYQMAEIEWRRAGGRLDGMMAVTHYAAMYYPARVLGDRELWPKLRDELLECLDAKSWTMREAEGWWAEQGLSVRRRSADGTRLSGTSRDDTSRIPEWQWKTQRVKS